MSRRLSDRAEFKQLKVTAVTFSYSKVTEIGQTTEIGHVGRGFCNMQLANHVAVLGAYQLFFVLLICPISIYCSDLINRWLLLYEQCP